MPDIRIAYRPFQQQLDFFQRKVSVPTSGWRDLWQSDHAHGFMVAGANRLALVDDFRTTIEQLMRGGRTLADFQREFDQIVARHGWVGWTGEGSAAGRAWRTRVIWETNLQQSYNAGRYAQLTHPDMLEARPYWEYRHNDLGISKMPRPQHKAWSGLVLRWDDPWWRSHFPQNGWGCKCGVRALGPADLRRRGLQVGTAPDGGTSGIDDGFAYNPGESARSLPAAQSFGERVMQMPPAYRQPALTDAQTRVQDWFGDFPQMVQRQAREHELLRAANAARALDPAAPQYWPRRTGNTQPMGMLRPNTVEALDRLGVAPPRSALLTATDEVAYHALRDAHGDLADLQAALLGAASWMASPRAVVLWDTQDAALIYCLRLDQTRFAKLVFRVDFSSKSGARDMRGRPINTLRTALIANEQNLRESRYVRLEGEW